MNFQSFCAALESRHLADLRFSEVTRALRALSSTYVQRRETALPHHRALDGAGKRAAFALYYGPIHFLMVQAILRELDVSAGSGLVIDVGCGTGVAGAAVATASDPRGRVAGFDVHPWALDEARFTYRAFGLEADVRRGDAARTRIPAGAAFLVAAFVVNELEARERNDLLSTLLAPAARQASVLIVEPISQRISPWWGEWSAAFTSRGGRADEWKLRVALPTLVKRLAKAAGLRPDALTARTLFLPASP